MVRWQASSDRACRSMLPVHLCRATGSRWHLNFQNINVYQQIGEHFAQVGNRARHHDVCDARYRANFEFGIGATLDPRNDELQIFNLVVDTVDLTEYGVGLGRRAVTTASAAEQLDSNQSLGVFHQAADARRRDVQQSRRATDGTRYHDRTDDFDLAQRKHQSDQTIVCQLQYSRLSANAPSDASNSHLPLGPLRDVTVLLCCQLRPRKRTSNPHLSAD